MSKVDQKYTRYNKRTISKLYYWISDDKKKALPTSLTSQRSIDWVIRTSLEFQRKIVTDPRASLTFYERAPPVHLHPLVTTAKVLLFLPTDVETTILHMSSYSYPVKPPSATSPRSLLPPPSFFLPKLK